MCIHVSYIFIEYLWNETQESGNSGNLQGWELGGGIEKKEGFSLHNHLFGNFQPCAQRTYSKQRNTI